MADKNQQSLANGIPQFQATNSMHLIQSNYNIRPSQAEMMPSTGVDHSSYSNQLHKPLGTMVNGQVSPNIRTSNWQPQPGYSVNNFPSSAGDTLSHQQSATTTSAQLSPAINTSKSNVSYPVNSQTDLSHSIHPAMTQSNPNMQPGRQNIIKPTPIIGNRPNALPSNIYQPLPTPGSGDAPVQSHMNDQPIKTSSSSFQHAGKPTTGPPPHLLSHSQVNKSLNGPSTSGMVPKTSPYNRPNITSLPNSTSMPGPPISSQSTIPSHNQSFHQGAYPPPTVNQMPNSNSSLQSFPQPTTQTSSLQQSFPGMPQSTHQLPGMGTVPQHTTYKSSVPNPPLRPPMTTYPNSVQRTSTYQNQFTGRMGPTGGPPPSSMPPPPPSSHEVPPPRSMHQMQNSTGNRLSSGGSNNMKHMGMNMLAQGMERMSVTQQGYNKLWGIETVDLLQCRNILPPQKVTPPPIRLHQEFMDSVNCNPDIFCCTLNKIPETNSLLQKSRLPLGILIHPFRDLSQLAVIQCSSIVRCRVCRTYINPFVYFVDNKRWKCNLCFRVNELPDEFQFDPVSKTYGDPSRRPEIRSSTIEFIAPSEYMLRPPQPAIYLFVLDVSRWGCDSGYLETLCSVLLEELDNIPGDSRTQIGFILFDSTIHFFSIAENYNQAHEMIVTDIDDVFLPTTDSLLVNLNENRQLIKDLLHELPKKYAESFDTDSALGPALQAAYKLMSPTGGRITVFQSCLPNKGPGALGPREDPNQRSSGDVRHLGPQTDFYKRLSLDCSTQQISVDLFLVSSQYSDLATLGGISQFSGGCIHHFPLYRRINPESNERLVRALRRYLTRKIGFEAVMRVRCSRGLSIHTFHGNFFVRSTDLLSLPNVNPDAGFGMQIAIEDSLVELQCVCFQVALLYTSAKGERRIRVHTLCLPVSSNLNDILTSADQQAIVGLLSKMAVDRSLKSSLSDAREAFINAAIDILSAYKLVETSGGQNSILAPVNLSLIPLYILALLKSTAFRTGQSTRLDDRVFAMSQLKTLPLRDLIQLVHPDLYHVTHLDDQTGVEFEEKLVAQPARLSLSSEHLDSRGAFLIDTPDVIYLLIGKNVVQEFLVNIFDVRDIRQVNKDMVELPELENESSEKLRHFINYLQAEKPWPAVMKIVTEPNSLTPFFVNDKAENALSYYELLHHIKAQIK